MNIQKSICVIHHINRLNKKNHLRKCRKHLTKSKPIPDKNSQQTRKRRELPQPRKGHQKKPTANVILNAFPPNVGNKARISTLRISFQHCTGGPSQWNNARERNKSHTYWKRISKTVSVYRQYDFVCWKSQRIYKKLSEPRSEFGKIVQG